MQIPKEKKIELHKIVEAHDIEAFEAFLNENLPGVLKTIPDSSLFMHEMKVTDLSYGEMTQHSRNAIKAMQFGYTDEFAMAARKCVECKFFREPPEDSEEDEKKSKYACMHLGAMPGDIQCPGFEQLKELGVAHAREK